MNANGRDGNRPHSQWLHHRNDCRSGQVLPFSQNFLMLPASLSAAALGITTAEVAGRRTFSLPPQLSFSTVTWNRHHAKNHFGAAGRRTFYPQPITRYCMAQWSYAAGPKIHLETVQVK